MNWLRRKNILVLSVFGLLLYLTSYYSRHLGLPNTYRDFCCADDRRLNLFLIFIPLSLFFIINIKSDYKKYINWARFSICFLVAYITIYFVVPTQGDGLVWFQRETVSFFGSILYSLVSLVLILYKSFKKE